MEHKIIKTDTDLYLASLVHERAQNATDPQNVYRLDFRRLSRLQHATDPLFSWKYVQYLLLNAFVVNLGIE